MKIQHPLPPSGIPCSKNFKSIENGVTFRKLGPVEAVLIGQFDGNSCYRADAMIVKDGEIVEQLLVNSMEGPLTAADMQTLRHAAWEVFHSPRKAA